MEIFPRRGVELSSRAEVRFPEAEYDRPAVVVKMANGARAARFTTATASYNFTVTFLGDTEDFNVMMAFIEAHGCVVPFTIVHPDYGEGTAYIAVPKHRIPKVVSGDPAWRRLEIPIEGQY